jgi:hypothetical protein
MLRASAVCAVSAVASPSVGVNSLNFCQTSSSLIALPSSSRSVVTGSIVLAFVACGDLAKIKTPTDSKGNTYAGVMAAKFFTNWPGSGARLYAATSVTGDSALVVSEPMAPDNNQDEVTLSVVEVRGGTSITHSGVAETPGTGPVTSTSVSPSGSAVLVSWWSGDGAIVQDDVQPSAGWTLAHALNWADASTGVVQVAAAYRVVSAGTYSCTWTATGAHGGGGQGGFAKIVSVE